MQEDFVVITIPREIYDPVDAFRPAPEEQVSLEDCPETLILLAD